MASGLPDEATADLASRVDLNLLALRHRPRIEWTDAAGGHAFVLDDRAIAGAAKDARICIDDRSVSRVHAELELRADGVWVRDLGSRNGTFIDRVLVESARVPAHGVVELGGATIRVTGAPATRVPLWPHDRFGPLLARSEAMRELFLRLSQYAASSAPVLIQGETGTGKELVARALHDASARAEGPFIVVDCAALPETLLESELFGHARGAFTGAVASRAGAFEAAAGGTVFLDEIGELPTTMQPKLLRVLESQTVRRLGETEHRRVDVRFVSATNRDLQRMVGAGTFREDMFFRLAVLPAFLPPLRSRPDDIPLLLAHFFAKSGAPPRLDPAMLAEMARHPWPGNVRELRAFAERALAVGPALAWEMTRGAESVPTILPPRSAPAAASLDADLPPVPTDVEFKVLRERWIDHLEREYMRSMLGQHGRDIGAIAAHAGLDRSYVHRLLRKHDL